MATSSIARQSDGLDSRGLALRGNGSARQSFDERGNGFAVPGISPQRRSVERSDRPCEGKDGQSNVMPGGGPASFRLATLWQCSQVLRNGKADQSVAEQRHRGAMLGDVQRGNGGALRSTAKRCNGGAWRVGAGHGNGEAWRR